jgi:hypothetical protein
VELVSNHTNKKSYVYSFSQCPTHIVWCFCFVFLRLVYHMIPVSLDCSYLIAPSVFSNVYILTPNKTVCCFVVNCFGKETLLFGLHMLVFYGMHYAF